MSDLIQISIDGLLIGMLYGLAGIGFGFLYIVLRRLDLAYGACLMAALYAVVAWGGEAVPLWKALAICLPVAILFLGYSQLLCFPVGSDRHATAAIAASFMVWMQFEEAVTLLMPAHHYDFPIQIALPDLALGPIALRLDLLILAALALAITSVLAMFMFHTRQGNAIRATVQQRTAAALCGVSPTWVWRACLVVSAIVGSIAAVSIASIDRAVTPMFGLTITLKAMVVLAIGGTERMFGPILGGVLLGLLEAHMQALAGPQFREFAIYALLFAWLPVSSLLTSRGMPLAYRARRLNG